MKRNKLEYDREWRKKHPGYVTEHCRAFRARNPGYDAKNVSKRHKESKRNFKEDAGNRCAICGYNRCSYALEFHHLDESQKKHEPSKLPRLSLKTALKELETCILLCANCHREVHQEFFVFGTPLPLPDTRVSG